MAVAFDAVGTDTSGNSATTNDNSTLTVGSGSNRALIVFVTHNNVAITAETVSWDPAGANQLMTLIGTQLEAIDNTRVSIYGLVNPASGNKIIRTAWTGAADFYVCGVCFTGVDQTGGTTSFPGYVGANGSSTTASVTITSAVGDLVVGAYISGNANYTSVNNTQIFLDTVNTNTSGAANRAGGAASVVMSGTLGASTNWAAGGNNIKAAASGVTNFDWQPFVNPVLRKNLFTPEQQFLAFVKAAPFPETVTESRWHQPWSEPSVKTKAGLAPANQQFLAFQNPTPLASFVSQLAWRVPFAEPVRTKPGLAAARQAYLFLNPQPFVSFSYFENLSDPVRTRSGLTAQQQQFLAYTAFTPTATSTVDGWGAQLSTPQRQLLGLPATEQQFFTADPSVIPTSNLPTWFYPWSDPARVKIGLAASLQDPYADFPFVDTIVESRWHQPWSEPLRAKAGLPTADQQFFAFSPFPIASTFQFGWFADLGRPTLPSVVVSTSVVEFVAVSSSETITVDKWYSPFAEVPKPKPGTTAAAQQFFFFDPLVFTPPVDGWASPFAEMPKARPGLTVAAQQALAYDPAVFAPIAVNWWFTPFEGPPPSKKGLSVQQQQALAWDPNTIFGESVLVSDWFRNLDPPPPPRAGLSAAQQQTLGWNANVIFAENVLMSAWFAEYSNPVRTLTGHSIPSGFDTGNIPPFPIPNPPQTQAKFTVSGPSVSDLFPVSGVVYPYAPETRKTVP